MLFALGKTWADVRSVPDGALSTVPDGPDVAILSVSVSPYPVPVNRLMTVTVSAISSATGADVGGQVLVNGTNVGTTGTPFQHTFRTRRVLIPGTMPREYEIIFPTAIVRAAGFPDTPIDLGF